jgi:hypothetical protein
VFVNKVDIRFLAPPLSCSFLLTPIFTYNKSPFVWLSGIHWSNALLFHQDSGLFYGNFSALEEYILD